MKKRTTATKVAPPDDEPIAAVVHRSAGGRDCSSDRVDPTLAIAVDSVLAKMPRFTEPVTLEDMGAYLGLLRERILMWWGACPPCEVYRHRATDPVTIRVGGVVRTVEPLPHT